MIANFKSIDPGQAIDAPQASEGISQRGPRVFCYTEIGGTPGYGIITTAGLKPFRALTERESEVLEDREDARQRIATDPVLAQAAVEAQALGVVGVPGGDIHRG